MTDQPSAFVQEVDATSRVIVLKVRVPGRSSFVVIGAREAGLVTAETRRAAWGGRLPPGSTREKAREASLVGARVVAIAEGEVFVVVGEMTRVIRALAGRVVITDAPPGGVPFVGASEAQRAAWEARGAVIVGRIAEEGIADRRASILRAIDRARTRIERRKTAIEGDLAKIAEADTIAAQAQWLVGEAARTPRGATRLVVTDWSSGVAVPLEIRLDPGKSAKEQVEAMFKRAKRLRLGGRVARDRLEQTALQLEGITIAREATENAASLVELETAAREGKRRAPRDLKLEEMTTGPTRAKEKTRLPYRTFFSRAGSRVLVGKGATDNDTLTSKVGRPHDLWLHAKDRTGAHVIVPVNKGKTCRAEDLVDAAHLAAHFSDAREEKVVDVQYTDRRHLRKPKGSPAGFVVVDREKVLVLRVDVDRVKELLEREEL